MTIPIAVQNLTGDAWLLFATRFVRLFAYGSLSVVLVFYLISIGLSEPQTGMLLTLTLVGASALASRLVDRFTPKPVLVAGLRVVVVTNISMVSVGAVIGIGGLGTWFTEGYQANKSDQIVAGILAIFVLAVIIDVALMFAGRIATPWVRVSGPGRRLPTAPVVGGSR